MCNCAANARRCACEPSFKPARRADLKPGAVFVVRASSGSSSDVLVGTRVVLSYDDGTDMPRFMRECGGGWGDNKQTPRWIALRCLEYVGVKEPNVEMVSIPKQLAADYVAQYDGRLLQMAPRVAHQMLATLKPMVDSPAITAAVETLTKAGWTVKRPVK